MSAKVDWPLYCTWPLRKAMISTGVRRLMPGTSCWMASRSSVVILVVLPASWSLRDRYEVTKMVLDPMPLKFADSATLKPCSSDTTAITDITPMMMPRVVSTLRSLWAKIAVNAARRLSTKLYTGRRLRRLLGVHGVADDLAVLDADHPAAMGGDVLVVGHHDDGVAVAVQLVEH